MHFYVYAGTSALVLIGLSWWRKYWVKHSHLPLPPGPPNLPLLGSILSLDNPTRPWLAFNSWRSTYGWGNILHANLRTTTHLLILQVT